MSCEGCHISGAGQNQALQNVIQQAKTYAKQNDKTVAVYKEGFEYFFKEAGAAIAEGIPVVQFISPNY